MNKTIASIVALALVLGLAVYMNAQRDVATEWQDGTYVGESEPDDRNQFGRVELTIENNRITNAQYDEFDSDGNMKDEEYPYPLAIEAQPQFEERLVEAQNPEQVDNISGATATWNKFKEAANDALEQAQQGN